MLNDIRQLPLASCLIYAWALPAHPYNA